jgi:FkbM family methyltransferase
MTLAEQLAPYLKPHCTTVIDVGARWGMADAWYRIPPVTKLIGFEPDKAECARLNRSSRPEERYVPLALHRYTGRTTLYRTADPACSSFYEPDQELVARYPEGLQCIRRAGRRTVPVVALDDWAERHAVADISFLKIDTQGSELDILKGAAKTLTQCVGVQVEVVFSPLYHGQPLFADVDRWLRRRGFTFWQFTELTSYSQTGAPLGRLFWANAIYFRDFAKRLGKRKHLLLACFFDALGDADGAYCCCQRAGVPGPIMERFQKSP